MERNEGEDEKRKHERLGGEGFVTKNTLCA
jgi:hypothetical protein